MNNKEPLLKDEVETFPFLNEEKPSKKNKLNKEIIITGIVTIIVLYFAWWSLEPFYVGFRYYDVAHPTKEEEDTKEEETPEISSSSLVLNNTYAKVNITDISSILNRIYSGAEITSFTEEEKLSIILNSIGLSCGSSLSVSSADLSAASISIFNEDSIITYLSNNPILSLTDYSISYDATTLLYNVTANACVATEDYVLKGIKSASNSDDELYIYEYFGYFQYNSLNNYNVYGNTLLTSLITNYTDESGTRAFSNTNILSVYKWTFKKSDANNYYFVSLMPI